MSIVIQAQSYTASACPDRCPRGERNLCWRAFHSPGDFMTAPLDPVIAGIIPLLPLRDPATMTPQSARDALRALAAARAAIPPPLRLRGRVVR